MKMTLYAESVSKSFGERKILRDARLRCQQGEIVGLLGLNGSGKSSLLKILYGTLKADQAALRVDQYPIEKGFYEQDLMAYLPQDSFLPLNIKVSALIHLYLENPEEQKRLKADSMLKRLLKNRVRHLSGGELRYLEIQLLLGLRRRFLLLDEPFTGIEPRYCQQIMRSLRTEAQDTGIIITDHLYENVLQVSDRVYLLKDGQSQDIYNRVELQKGKYLPQNSN